MENREHHDLAPLLPNLINYNVWPFDQLLRPRVDADATHASKPGKEQQFQFTEDAVDKPLCGSEVIFCDPAEDALKILKGIFLKDQPHPPERRKRLRASASEMYVGSGFVRLRRSSVSCSSVR